MDDSMTVETKVHTVKKMKKLWAVGQFQDPVKNAYEAIEWSHT